MKQNHNLATRAGKRDFESTLSRIRRFLCSLHRRKPSHRTIVAQESDTRKRSRTNGMAATTSLPAPRRVQLLFAKGMRSLRNDSSTTPTVQSAPSIRSITHCRIVAAHGFRRRYLVFCQDDHPKRAEDYRTSKVQEPSNSITQPFFILIIERGSILSYRSCTTNASP